MGSSGERAGVRHRPAPKCTHLLSLQGCQFHPLPCLLCQWAKPRIQGFGAAGRGLFPGAFVFSLPFLTLCACSVFTMKTKLESVPSCR